MAPCDGEYSQLIAGLWPFDDQPKRGDEFLAVFIRQYGRRALTAVLFVLGLYLTYKVSEVEGWTAWCWALLFVLSLDADRDRKAISWLRYLPVGLIVLFVPYYIYKHSPDLWWSIARWQNHTNTHLWNWNHLFASIPGNDGEYFRTGWPFRYLQYPRFTVIMQWVYSYGFSMCIWISMIRSFLARDARKGLRYTVATHLTQYPLIMPFYNLILLQEVWFVKGWPDPFGRHLDHNTLLVWVQNCFPSMHTSVSFAVLLLALREKGPIFKWGMVAYCTSIIFSTLYLGIHWVLDLPAGMLLGWFCVKIADWTLNKWWPEKAEHAAAPAPALSTGATQEVSA